MPKCDRDTASTEVQAFGAQLPRGWFGFRFVFSSVFCVEFPHQPPSAHSLATFGPTPLDWWPRQLIGIDWLFNHHHIMPQPTKEVCPFYLDQWVYRTLPWPQVGHLKHEASSTRHGHHSLGLACNICWWTVQELLCDLGWSPARSGNV